MTTGCANIDMAKAEERQREAWSARRSIEFRAGHGFDVHRFGPGDHVWLCGVCVPHGQGLIGHSDADVGLHALTDALLGTIGAGDIGQHFPPSDPRWRGAASSRFLTHAAGLINECGGQIMQVDVTLVCDQPRIEPYRHAMIEGLARWLRLDRARCGVKAGSTAGLGFTGRHEGIAATAVAIITLPAGRC